MIAMSDAQVHECLTDAGCSPAQIDQFDALRNTGSLKDQLRLLENHRRLLLDSIHSQQKKLDCLDYLVWNIKTAV